MADQWRRFNIRVNLRIANGFGDGVRGGMKENLIKNLMKGINDSAGSGKVGCRNPSRLSEHCPDPGWFATGFNAIYEFQLDINYPALIGGKFANKVTALIGRKGLVSGELEKQLVQNLEESISREVSNSTVGSILSFFSGGAASVEECRVNPI
eukprot:TRINITY_DN8296_c0_g1_i1.p1 TRINITY_DN8296_c0_g1~~TRINITY_DN8296_c0_g1_i1.p1  ORF type:complete len:153 (+),score=38.78 TRINITY_DN8296_c0_g1_i1:78-536(+)